MSKIQKNKKTINFHSSGAFLNLNKPKLLSIHNFPKNKLKKKKSRNNNYNISQDLIKIKNISKIIENNNNKDEIIKTLKNNILILEKKVKYLEKQNNNSNIPKTNKLNLSHDSSIKDNSFNSNIKINMKLVKKNTNNIFTILNISNNFKKDQNKTISNNTCMNISKKIDYYNNKSKNFLSIFNIKNKEEKINKSGYKNIDNYNYKNNNFLSIYNINNTEKKINKSESKNKSKKFIIIPRKKLFNEVLKKSLIKYCSIDNNKLKNNKLKKDFYKNIPKIPRKKNQHKSTIVNNSIDKYKYKYNELSISPENKKIYNSEKKNDFSTINNSDTIEKNNCNEINFKNIKNKLENIKLRIKNLLEYYDSNINNHIESTEICKKFKLYNIVNNE